MTFSSETDTVIKRILPYLVRRGYDVKADMSFEDPVQIAGTPRKGFIDILVKCGRANPIFLIEAKRDGTKITAKHRQQALEYGHSEGVLLVAITNGQTFELLNTTTKKPLLLNGSMLDRIPSRKDFLGTVLPQLKKEPACANILIPADRGLPFRAGLPLSKLNHLIKNCHNLIRNIEKDEEHAFSDFSKFMFLKLLEEKWDQEQSTPPYSYTFHELAAYPKGKIDQIQIAIKSMIDTIKSTTPYGKVLADPIRLTKNASYQRIVTIISGVSFSDCDLDSKGAAFEYFVRATLKGKKLGQYFTPRPLVKLMLSLGRWEQIVNSLAAGEDFKVADPACGTGGFLVLAMNRCLDEIDSRFKSKMIHKSTAESLRQRVKSDVFYGVDAHDGVACSAKMNMIIAGDGYNNIRCADSPNEAKLIPPYRPSKPLDKDDKCRDDGRAHLILTNPPFGTSEAESLSEESAQTYEIQSSRGQLLFIQLMIRSAHTDSLIVTVIDKGVLNTASYAELRRLILQKCRIEAVLELPDETFKPNKINVKASVLVLRRRGESDEDLSDNYPIAFVSIKSLGYEGSGSDIRGFDLNRLIEEVSSIDVSALREDELAEGYMYSAFSVQSKTVATTRSLRMDVSFWNPSIRMVVDQLKSETGGRSVEELNTIETKRGKSPPAAEYVSASEGYALVVKSGSNISKNGDLVAEGADYVERAYFQSEYIDKNADRALQDGDVLLASTGDGTLGKCCVYRNADDKGQTKPGIPEGHVTVIRVDQSSIWPEYLCDYLRKGLGHDQIVRLTTGSTGLVEIATEDVNEVLIPRLPSIAEQKKISNQLRNSERSAADIAAKAVATLRDGEDKFRQATLSMEPK
jgi:type I restriction enzyme M protein